MIRASGTTASAGTWESRCSTDGSVLTAYGKYVDGAAVLTKWNPIDCPEPSTWALLVTGLFGLLVHAWRKRR